MNAATPLLRRSGWGLAVLSAGAAPDRWRFDGSFYGSIDDVGNTHAVVALRALLLIWSGLLAISLFPLIAPMFQTVSAT